MRSPAATFSTPPGCCARRSAGAHTPRTSTCISRTRWPSRSGWRMQRPRSSARRRWRRTTSSSRCIWPSCGSTPPSTRARARRSSARRDWRPTIRSSWDISISSLGRRASTAASTASGVARVSCRSRFARACCCTWRPGHCAPAAARPPSRSSSRRPIGRWRSACPRRCARAGTAAAASARAGCSRPAASRTPRTISPRSPARSTARTRTRCSSGRAVAP